jgi:flagellum-specific ATP synthase
MSQTTFNKVGNGGTLIDFERFHTALQGASLHACYGAVVRVAGLTVESAGPKACIGQICGICSKDKRVQAEVIGFRDGNLILLPLEHFEGISPGDRVSARSDERKVNVGYGLLGRVLDGLGRPIDGKGPINSGEFRRLDSKSPDPLWREKINKPLATGIRAIDGMLTCGKGQRVGIFAGSGVGKSVLLGEMANGSTAKTNVLALVGERGREVRQFLEEDLGPEGLAKSVVIVATSDAPAIQRVRAGFVAVAIAEYFRDQGEDVLFMMDSLTRFAQAQREIGLAAGEPPTSKGYTPSVFALMPRLVERLGCAEKGSITGMLTVLAEGDDMNDPVADSARSLLDGHIVLSRKLAHRGHYPAIDILSSISRLMPNVVDTEHKKAAARCREVYATYMDAEDLITIGAYSPGSNRRIDKAVALIDRVREVLIQPVRQRSAFEQTVQKLGEISKSWDALDIAIAKDKK